MIKPLPRPPRHLHVFGLSLLFLVGALMFFLFAVQMDATVPATGIVTSPRIVAVRAIRDGIVEKPTSAMVKIEPNSEQLIAAKTEIARIRSLENRNVFSAFFELTQDELAEKGGKMRR